MTARLLGDANRVRILEALARGPLRTAELSVATGMSAAALSRHLNLLRSGGVLQRDDVDGDGRGRAYRVRPAALEPLSTWLRSTGWAAELSMASARPQARDMLTRIGGFLDAFALGDVEFFDRHLRDDAVLVFPGAPRLYDKQGCLDSVTSHPRYRDHRIVDEPVLQALGSTTTAITCLAHVATAADETVRRMFITAVIEEGDPWQLAHLQWTPSTADIQKGK
jgi:DNA-binding transcriptional ArsR family regulator